MACELRGSPGYLRSITPGKGTITGTGPFDGRRDVSGNVAPAIISDASGQVQPGVYF
jgi:hypothetical protein